jgi:hypothetical protein
MKTISVNTFDGGMTNDARDPAQGIARITEHVDNFTRSHLIANYPDNDFNAATDPNTASEFDSNRIQKFLYSNSTWFGLGVQAGTTKPKIFTKSAIANAWAAGTTTGDYAALVSSLSPTIFIQYHNYLYGLDGPLGSTNWWKYGDITSTPTWTRLLHQSTNVAGFVVHSKDDILYYINGSGTAVQQQIGKFDGTTWTEAALTFGISGASNVPSLSTIAEYGNYLAIAANNPDATTTLYLWDRDSSLTTVSEKVDWGTGTIKWLATIDGTLIGCSILQASGLGLEYTVVFKYYDGTAAIPFAQFNCTSATVYPITQKFNNTLEFMAEMNINSVDLRGIWKVVKKNGQFSVSFDRKPRLDDTVTAGKLYGFLRTGDYFHIACANVQDSDKYIVTKTLNAYSTTSVYRTAINPNVPLGDRTALKQLVSLAASTEPLTSGQAVLVQYRVDGGSWIPALYMNTVGAVSSDWFTGAITTPSGGTFNAAGNYTAGREYEFSIEPSGGAKVSELKFIYNNL